VEVVRSIERGVPDGGEAQEAAQPCEFDVAVEEFAEYLGGYRNYSPSTITAHHTDLRQFRQFLVEKLRRAPGLEETAREWIIQFGVKRKGAAPLTVRRKYACLASFFGYLMDMDRVRHKPTFFSRS